MNIVQRVQDILLKPRETWAQIGHESADAASLYTQYIMVLAAIGPVASFIGLTVVGAGLRVPVMAGLSIMIVQYVMTLVMVYVLALIVDALAPSFGGTRDRLRALKLVAYGSTAALVGGVFGLIPSLSILGLLASLYSIYLVYLGLPVLMRCPEDKAAAYTAVVAVLGLVASLFIGLLAGIASPGMHGMGWRNMMY
jgi:hypothetical protein